jgi:hypothetical protein
MSETEELQARMSLSRKASAVVEQRKYTDRPGSEWHLDELRTPRHCGVHGVVYIYVSDDASAYDVIAYDYKGAEIRRARRKGLDAAFRAGQKLVSEEA